MNLITYRTREETTRTPQELVALPVRLPRT